MKDSKFTNVHSYLEPIILHNFYEIYDFFLMLSTCSFTANTG
jgi:hypothetical protein